MIAGTIILYSAFFFNSAIYHRTLRFSVTMFRFLLRKEFLEMPDDRYRLVYSDQPVSQRAPRPPGTGRVRVRLERRNRAGKTVTVVEGLALSQAQARALLQELQAACGTGGTVKENRLELQGDQRQKVAEHLQTLGYRVAVG
jgi:translation initiation factor 1